MLDQYPVGSMHYIEDTRYIVAMRLGGIDVDGGATPASLVGNAFSIPIPAAASGYTKVSVYMSGGGGSGGAGGAQAGSGSAQDNGVSVGGGGGGGASARTLFVKNITLDGTMHGFSIDGTLGDGGASPVNNQDGNIGEDTVLFGIGGLSGQTAEGGNPGLAGGKLGSFSTSAKSATGGDGGIGLSGGTLSGGWMATDGESGLVGASALADATSATANDAVNSAPVNVVLDVDSGSRAGGGGAAAAAYSSSNGAITGISEGMDGFRMEAVYDGVTYDDQAIFRVPDVSLPIYVSGNRGGSEGGAVAASTGSGNGTQGAAGGPGGGGSGGGGGASAGQFTTAQGGRGGKGGEGWIVAVFS